jgi:F-type H+-transporting ATPase subunit b
VKSLLHYLAIAAALACGAGFALAQDDEPAAPSGGAESAAPARARRGRPAATKRLIARRRQALAQQNAVEVLHAEQAPTAQPAARVEQAPPELAAHDSGVDSSPALPGIGAVHEASEPTAPGETAPHGEGHGEDHEAHGAGHGEHAGFSGKTFALQLLNFGVLLFLLIRFGGRAMNKSLRARHEQLKSEISEASRLRDEATVKFQAQEKRVAELEKEIAALRVSLRQDAEREQARLIEGAQERAKRIQEEMRLQLNQQIKEAESLLRAEVANASVKLAEELVRRSVNTDDQRRLAREFVAGFDGPSGPTGPEGHERIVG